MYRLNRASACRPRRDMANYLNGGTEQKREGMKLQPIKTSQKRKGSNVRIRKYAFMLTLSAGMLMAASSFNGNWKMDHDQSKYKTGDVPKNETIAISDQGDHLVVAVAGTDDDGKPIAIHYVVPVSGGDGQMQQQQQGGPYNGVSEKRTNDNTRDTTFTKDGKPVLTQHMVVAADGKTMTVRVKGIDAEGKPVEGTLVFDKQ
jgi:protocatechuate 3,4-dioxygenase beta subunit